VQDVRCGRFLTIFGIEGVDIVTMSDDSSTFSFELDASEWENLEDFIDEEDAKPTVPGRGSTNFESMMPQTLSGGETRRWKQACRAAGYNPMNDNLKYWVLFRETFWPAELEWKKAQRAAYKRVADKLKKKARKKRAAPQKKRGAVAKKPATVTREASTAAVAEAAPGPNVAYVSR